MTRPLLSPRSVGAALLFAVLAAGCTCSSPRVDPFGEDAGGAGDGGGGGAAGCSPGDIDGQTRPRGAAVDIGHDEL